MPDNQTTENYTVVYRVAGGKQVHDEWWQTIRPLFLADAPVRVTGISVGDMMEKVDQLEAAAQERANAE